MEISIQFTSLAARKDGEPKGPVNVKNSSALSGVALTGKDLVVDYTYTSTFEPGIGEIKVLGKVSVKGSEKELKEALKAWEASGGKNLPKDLAEQIHNLILLNCLTETMLLAREVRLPSPLPMPKVSLKDKSKSETENYIR